MKTTAIPYRKGRGAQQNISNQFIEGSHELLDDFLEFCRLEGETPETDRTRYIEVFPKTIVNKVQSPDVGMMYSMNPYQGCEHGCVYCYARNSHEYWGYSAGLDFERVILIKKNAPQLLEEKLNSRNWKAHPIVLSGNTDCYQPAEKKFEITRALLKIFLKYKHPVSIITKNALVLRDLDILKELAKDELAGVYISITSLDEKIRTVLEPRTVTLKKRFETLRLLSENGIPVSAMMAPIIPGINSHEILPLAKAASEAGALSIAFTVVRLNGAIGQVFTDWIRKALPEKADKVLHQISQCHGGNLGDNRYTKRMYGEGKIAEQLQTLFKVARQKYFKGKTTPKLNTLLFETARNGQLHLF